jgi:D-cysteine desulfhydrase
MLDLDLDRLALGERPTPVRELAGISAEGVAPVWIKDDGVYGRYGGNKARKLEWLLGDVRRRGRTTVITGGAIGTNHGLATALYAREVGLRTVLVLVPQPKDDHVRAQARRIRESGAEVHLATGTARAFGLAATLMVRRAGPGLRLPYLILPGGSVPLGCLGYVEAGLELGGQVAAGDIPEPSHVVVAIGSGGTAAGLLLGLRMAGLRSRLVAVLVNDLTPISARGVARLARRTQRLLRRHSIGPPPPRVALSASDLALETDWLGRGYGHPTVEGTEAIESFRSEGVVLDPVYTAKAAAALLELNRRGRFGDGPVLYWHTFRPPEDADAG